MAELLEEQRENWGTRTGFVLAAIGSAVGLGNLWGFPYKLYSFGGGAFLIPYLIAMLLIGIPLLVAEFSLGHLTQRATPDAFARANRRFAFVGWWQIILSFVIITYYAVILAYCLSFLYYSVQGIFAGELPWAGKGLAGVQRAKAFFFSDYLSFNESFSLGRLQWHIAVSLVACWAAMYLCICRGVRLVGKVVMWTVPLPWLMLLILTIRGMTLDGTVGGLEFYLEPNWSQLSDPVTWRWAFGQMFFSMSLAFGIMITYASFLHRKSDLNNNAAVIGLADVGTSFVAGLAVFATLGGMAFATRQAAVFADDPSLAVPVEQVAESGPSLAFVAFPYALAQLPQAAWFSLLFFASLLLLGIDSAFSITESVLASIVDKTGWGRGRTLIALSVVGLAIGLLFCTQGGLTWLGTFDDFINGTWGITLTALLECLVLGWLFRLRRLRAHANERSDWRIGPWWDWAVRLVIPVVLAALFAWSLFDSLADPRGYASRYQADPVTVEVPASDALPDRPVLQLRFLAGFSGETEHAFSLAETADAKEAEKIVEGWRLGGPAGEPLDAGFKPEDLLGRRLAFTATGLTPRTAYAVDFRWNSRPRINRETMRPVEVPPARQPKWTRITEVTTTRKRAGMNVGNTAGLSLMAVAPVLAILIGWVRIRRDQPAPLFAHAAGEAPPVAGRAAGALATLLSLGALAALAAAMAALVRASIAVRAGTPVEEAIGYVAGVPAILVLLVGAGVAAVLAMVCGGPAAIGAHGRGRRPAALAQLGAALGVLALGVGAGLALAFVMTTQRFTVRQVTYDSDLSAAGYAMLAVVLALIVVGLLWCFYRAIKAAAGARAEEQLSDNGQ